VDAVDGDVAKGGSGGELGLQLCEPGLKVELAVGVGARVCGSVCVREVKGPVILHAGSCAHNAGIFGAGK